MEKTNLIINSSIDIGSNLELETNGKGRHFTSRFIEAGVAHYEQFGDVLITKETLDKFINSMVGCPVIIKHKDITDENADKERVGVVSRVWFNDFDGWYWCEGIIWDKQAIDLIKNQGWNVSCTYDFESDKLPKTHNGKKVDMEFTDGEFLHLALVPNPRYERANIVINSKAENEDKWITIHPNGEDAKGRHLLIKDGETPKEAIDRVYKKEDKKDDFEKETKATKKDENRHQKVIDLEDKAYKEFKKTYDNYIQGDVKISDFSNAKEQFNKKYKDAFDKLESDRFVSFEDFAKRENNQSDTKDKFSLNKELSTGKEPKKYTWDNKKYTADELMEQGFHPMKYSGSIYKDDHLTYLEKNDGKKLYRVKISEDEYKELKQKKDEKNRPIGLSEVSSLLSDENKFKRFADDLYYNEPYRANVSGELRQKLYHTIHTNTPLTKSEWDERLKRQLKKINKANNSLLNGLDEILTHHKPEKEDLPILEGLKDILGE